MNTYSQYQDAPSSEKCGLVILEATRRLLGWSPYAGSIYCTIVSEQVIESITDNGVALTESATLAGVTAGKWFFDRQAGLLYAWTASSADPASRFITMLFRMFFSNLPVDAPHDLSTGHDVPWLPLLDPRSVFSYEIDGNNAMLGVAVSNASGLRMYNDKSFWDPIWDNVFFENQRILIYSWNRGLPITEAKVLYKGRVSKRTYGDMISFEVRDFLDELRSPVSMPNIGDYVGARVPDSLISAKQRTLYGYVKGHIPTNIDQVIPTIGYPLTGTFTLADGGTTIAGSGTSFLSELSPGDDIIVGTALKVRIDAISSDTALTLSAAYSGDPQTGVTATVLPSHNKRYANRIHLVAGHALSRPEFEVTEVVDNAIFMVASTEGLLEGDQVEFAGSGSTIRVLGDTLVKLIDAFTGSLIVGSMVYRSSVGNVYLDGELLTLTRDYTYDPATAVITLTETAEFNVAQKRKLTGTIAITISNRNVVGTTTQFRTELRPGDWVNVAAGSNWYEVLEVVDDLNLIVRTVPGSSESGAALFKNPNVYGARSVLTCDAIGKESSGGDFLRLPGAIAMDLLTAAGLEDDIDVASFGTADDLLPHRIGFAVPKKFNDKKAPALRDVLNTVCRSSFSSIIISKDFELQMVSLDPSYGEVPTEFNERDFTDFNVESDNSQIVSAAEVTYDNREWDAASAAPLDLVKRVENDQYLFSTEKEFSVGTYLLDEDDAEIMASRWAFMLARTNSDVVFKTKLQGARLQVFDVVKINHEKLYMRFGSQERTRLGVVMSVRKSIGDVEVVINDLGNAFSRAARITEDDALDFDAAADSEKVLNGYQTDEDGLTDDIDGLNVIW